jgi:hypothetical protein
MLKKLFLIISCTMLLGVFAYNKLPKTNKPINPTEPTVANNPSIKVFAKRLKKYIDTSNYNTDYAFIINMKIASGKKRFFVYNLKKDSIERSGLVTHGEGSETEGDDLVFNNTPNGLATSLGKYKIGAEYYGKFGLAYKLHGLDKTNSKAFERFVVLHGHDCVPGTATYPQPICVSQGCPTVNPAFLKKLKPIINKASKPILLEILYE